MACLILQKQIEHIDGKKENIVIPSIKMKQIREQEGKSIDQIIIIISTFLFVLEARRREPTTNITQSIPNTTDIDMTTSQSTTNESVSSQSSVESATKATAIGSQGEAKTSKTTTITPATNDQDHSAPTPSNPCVLCLTEEKRLACIPCGHLATCVPCGHSLRSCPICRREIEAFVRIYI